MRLHAVRARSGRPRRPSRRPRRRPSRRPPALSRQHGAVLVQPPARPASQDGLGPTAGGAAGGLGRADVHHHGGPAAQQLRDGAPVLRYIEGLRGRLSERVTDRLSESLCVCERLCKRLCDRLCERMSERLSKGNREAFRKAVREAMREAIREAICTLNKI